VTEPWEPPIDEFLDLCSSSRDAWLSMLRQHKLDIAMAAGGLDFTVELVIKGVCKLRVGILATGNVVVPMGGGDPPDLRLLGTPAQIRDFLLGKQSLIRAELDGLVIASPHDPATRDRLRRVRLVVADVLRGMAEGRPLALLAGRRLLGRVRSALAPAVDAASFAERIVPMVVAVCTSLAVPTSATASGAPRVVEREAAPAMASVSRLALEAPPASSRQTTSTSAENRAPDLARGGLEERPPQTEVRSDSQLHATVVNETPGARGSSTTMTSADLSCQPPIRSLTCIAADQASELAPSPVEGGG
jgi:hypothetical protein